MKVRSLHGFVLAEVILVLIISSVLIATLLAGLVALVRGMQPQAVSIAGETLPIAPTFGAFPSAMRLHQSFSDQVAAARAVYVFGGAHLSIPAEAAPAALTPLKLRSLPTLTDLSRGLPMDAKSFYDLYADVLGEGDGGVGSEDYTVICVGPVNGVLGLSCLVQVRTTTVRVTDGTAGTVFAKREVMLWTVEQPQAQRYAFLERASSGRRGFVGAVHTWVRYGDRGSIREEGPACVVFPDPWLYAGSRGQPDDLPAFSRFGYLLAVSP